MSRTLTLRPVFAAKSVPAGTTVYSEAFDIQSPVSGENGNFSAQLVITGDGTLAVGYVCSNDGITYLAAEDTYSGTIYTPIATALTKTSGPVADGNVMIGFKPQFARYYKMSVAETGGLNDCVVTGILATY